MPWFLGVACLFEGGPPEELAVFFPILLEAMFALTLFDLVGVVVKVRFWVEKVGQCLSKVCEFNGVGW